MRWREHVEQCILPYKRFLPVPKILLSILCPFTDLPRALCFSNFLLKEPLLLVDCELLKIPLSPVLSLCNSVFQNPVSLCCTGLGGVTILSPLFPSRNESLLSEADGGGDSVIGIVSSVGEHVDSGGIHVAVNITMLPRTSTGACYNVMRYRGWTPTL